MQAGKMLQKMRRMPMFPIMPLLPMGMGMGIVILNVLNFRRLRRMEYEIRHLEHTRY